jgi:predicted nucleotidyltransferase component of viral defense system
VTNPQPKNIAASVHNRLLNRAKESDRSFNELLQYYAIERFLYRLSLSAHTERFILKGALMLMVWESPLSRSTMDIDMLGKMENSVDKIISIVQEVCRQDVEPDGIIFDPESVQGQRITEDADYEGVRIRFRGSLATARISMQLDVGFGDVVFPSPELKSYPTLLDLPAPIIRSYSMESAIAEKFEAMVKRGVMNSRMKDFWDIWLLSRQFDFAGQTLSEAIVKTFLTRHTVMPPVPIAFTPAFAQYVMKAAQWKAFLRKNRMVDTPENFEEIIQTISTFLMPIVESIVQHQSAPTIWKSPGPWQGRE